MRAASIHAARRRGQRIPCGSLVTLALLFSLASATARANPCDGRRLPEGPLPVGFSQGDFGIMRGACPRSELGLGVGGRAIVENENFYGNIRAGSRFDVKVRALPRLELSATVEPLAYQLVIQSYRADHLGLGDSSLGAKLLAVTRPGFALSVTTRLHVPTAFGLHRNSWPWAVDSGVLWLVEPIERLRLRGGLLAAVRFAHSKAGADPRAALIANAGADVVFFDWMAAVVDIDAQALERGGLDLLALGVGARFVIVDTVGVEVGARIPVAGDERNLLAAVARVSWRFD